MCSLPIITFANTFKRRRNIFNRIVLEREEFWNRSVFILWSQSPIFFLKVSFKAHSLLLEKIYTVQRAEGGQIFWRSRSFSFYFTVAWNTCYTGLPPCVAFLVPFFLCQLTATSGFTCPLQWTIVPRSAKNKYVVKCVLPLASCVCVAKNDKKLVFFFW